ncbi:AsmA-like C-terminal region [Rubritalea squalenifaciens DSM 18772]|uniref:AsmA-like C-terminal region n=1 Tax=Rubritalea squalenifaciens DSM 18772 TaxID=1123071 RepID=A0A1M6MF80_9BACT|nr:AsmA-like C-terminal region-containing protein [Rubritalea squalenifaciens]SHJ82006.1 AsmA-like C-terminal region [Rubritalea squalenifaciens DSM 18772]
MSFRRLIIRLRMLLTLLMVLGCAALVGGAVYLNEVGLNDTARDRISKELEDFGIYTDFDSLRYDITKGLTADNVTIYKTKKKLTPVAKLPNIVISVDKTKLMRGTLKIERISLIDAFLDLPVNPTDPNSPRLVLHNASGTINLPDKDAINTSDLSATFRGIHIKLACNIWRDLAAEAEEPDAEASRLRAEKYQAFLDHLSNWTWDEGSPPDINLFLQGNLSAPENMELAFKVRSSDLSYKSYQMEQVDIEGDYKNDLITFDKLAFINQDDDFSTTADFDLIHKEGRFKVNSSIHFQNFARQCFNYEVASSLLITGGNYIQANGSFKLPANKNEKLNLKMIGHAVLREFNYRGTLINQMESDFSWNNGDVYLDKLEIDHPEGTITGRILIKDDLTKFDAVSSLKARTFFPFLKNENLKRILSRIEFTEESKIRVTATGSINRNDPRDWESTGHGSFTNITYNGVALDSLSSDYNLNRASSDFFNIRAILDFRDYELRKQFGGSATGTVEVAKIHFDRNEKYVDIDEIKATSWPSPVIRLFNTPAADHVESYRFHSPPTITGGGRIGTVKGSQDTKLSLNVVANSTTDYNFLKRDLNLRGLKAKVIISPNLVEVNNLSARTFSGPVSGYVHVALPREKGDPSHYSGRLQWDKLQLNQLGRKYELNNTKQGHLTGAFKFTGESTSVNKLNGHGNIALANGNMFSAPVLGPLSTLIDGVLSPVSKQKMLHERAKNASCNFTVKNGVFYTRDLVSTTPNITFTGEGWIDLNRELIDLTIRMNYRGLMGLAEVPMKIIELPFQALRTILSGKQVKGLRQFRGTGKLSDPKWRFTPFEPPRDGKNDPIFKKPPRAQIVE